MRSIIRTLCSVILETALLLAAGCGGDSDEAVTPHRHATTSSGAGGQGGGGGEGGSVDDRLVVSNISEHGTGLESESTVAVGKDGIVAAAWIGMSGSSLDIGYVFSSDDGATWGTPELASPADARSYGDPTLATGPDGSIYLAFMGFQFVNGGDFITDAHVFVAKAEPGATTFGPPVEVSDPAVTHEWDKPVVAVTDAGTVIVTYSDVSTGEFDVARSVDGTTYTQTSFMSKSSFGAFAFPCPAAGGGRLWVTYLAPVDIMVRWSDDDGATWPAENETIASGGEHDVSAEDPTCAGVGKDLYVAYGRSKDKTDTFTYLWKDYAIRVAHSGDGGQTFDTRADAHDPSLAAYFLEPYLLREPGGGLDVAFYAGNADGDKAGSFVRTRSTDGGATFSPSSVLASPLTFSLTRFDDIGLGDYEGLVEHSGRLYATYSDNSSGRVHVSFVRTSE